MSIPEDYIVKKSRRKTAAIEIHRDLSVVVRVPLYYSDKKTEAFVFRNGGWIGEHLEKQRRRNEQLRLPVDTDPELLKAEAAEVIPPLVERYSALMGLQPKGIKITSAKGRLGSCSSDNTLRFSYTLMLYPREAAEYVVVHELAHIRHRNHKREFYSLIAEYLPDWEKRRALLRV